MADEALVPLQEPGEARRALPDEGLGPLFDEMSEFTATAAALFFAAEHDENPQVADYWDAYHYVATSLSVGYAQIFPITPMGKLLGAIVMMLGPSLSSHALDPPTAREEAKEQALLGRLDAILGELRALREAAGP